MAKTAWLISCSDCSHIMNFRANISSVTHVVCCWFKMFLSHLIFCAASQFISHLVMLKHYRCWAVQRSSPATKQNEQKLSIWKGILITSHFNLTCHSTLVWRDKYNLSVLQSFPYTSSYARDHFLLSNATAYVKLMLIEQNQLSKQCLRHD